MRPGELEPPEPRKRKKSKKRVGKGAKDPRNMGDIWGDSEVGGEASASVLLPERHHVGGDGCHVHVIERSRVQPHRAGRGFDVGDDSCEIPCGARSPAPAAVREPPRWPPAPALAFAT